MKNPSTSRQEMQLSGGKDVKLFGGGDGAPCETGNAASFQLGEYIFAMQTPQISTLQVEIGAATGSESGSHKRRAHLISSRSDRGPHGERPPTIAIWNEVGLAVRYAGATMGRSHPRKYQSSMALADHPREPNASAEKQRGGEEAED